MNLREEISRRRHAPEYGMVRENRTDACKGGSIRTACNSTRHQFEAFMQKNRPGYRLHENPEARAWTGLTVIEFQHELAKRGLCLNYDVEDFQSDVRTLQSMKLL